MNKRLIILATIITLLLITTVIAQTSTINNGTITIPSINPKDPTPKIDNIFEKEILINENIAVVVRVLTGIKGPVTLSFGIIIILIWLMMLIFLKNIIILTPFFKGITSWIGAIIINLLIALSGGMNFLTRIFLETGSIFKFLEEWTTGALIFSIILVIIIFLVLGKAMKFIKRKEEIMKAEEESTKIGVNLGFMGNLRKMFNWGDSLSKP